MCQRTQIECRRFVILIQDPDFSGSLAGLVLTTIDSAGLDLEPAPTPML